VAKLEDYQSKYETVNFERRNRIFQVAFHSHRKNLGGRGTAGNTAVFGMVERNGRVKAKVVSDTDGRTLIPDIQASVPQGAAIISDGMASYDNLRRLGYQHETVPHAKGIYILGKDIHTNTFERLFEG